MLTALIELSLYSVRMVVGLVMTPCLSLFLLCFVLCAVKKFLEIKYARDVLLDPKKKEQYDKKLSHELMAKKKQREREAELDGKRRQMRDGAFWMLLSCSFFL